MPRQSSRPTQALSHVAAGGASGRPKHRRPRAGPGLLFSDTRGLSTVEYVMLLSLIVVVGFGAWRRLGRTIEGDARRAEMVVARVSGGGLP